MEINYGHVFCLILILGAILVGIWLSIWLIKSYNNKRRVAELEHERTLATIRQLSTETHIQLSGLTEVIQALLKSNKEIVEAWIGREKIEKEQERVRSDRAQDASSKTNNHG